MTVSDSGSPMVIGGDGMGFGGSGFIWAFLIFALLMGNGGFGFGGNNGNANANAIEAGMNRGFDNQNSMANQREILSAVTNGTAQSVAATNQTFHDMLGAFNDKYTELQRDISTVQVTQANALANQNQCCCETKMALAEGFAGTNANIAQSRYDAALNTAAINANVTAQTQKVLDAMAQNKIETLQGRVNQLELQNSLAGVVRYPQSMTYGAGPSPFCAGAYNGYPLYS